MVFTPGSVWYQVYVNYAINNDIIGATDFNNYTDAATRAQMAQTAKMKRGYILTFLRECNIIILRFIFIPEAVRLAMTHKLQHKVRESNERDIR